LAGAQVATTLLCLGEGKARPGPAVAPLPGAGLLDLDPMDPADARALLQRLAPRLDDEGADAIAKLCGHLPLALRVAGNYLHLNDDVSTDQYATLLADERDRLAHLRDPDDPDLDVEAIITLSVAQLDDETRLAWALLALFPAPFDLAAAGALWGELREWEQAARDERFEELLPGFGQIVQQLASAFETALDEDLLDEDLLDEELLDGELQPGFGQFAERLGAAFEVLDEEQPDEELPLDLVQFLQQMTAAAFETELVEMEPHVTLSHLQVLHNHNLVAYDAGTGRYHQHALLQLAAGRELADSAAGEIAAARERHARHYLAVACDVLATQRYLDLDPDWPHLRAALEHAVASTNVELLILLVHAVVDYLAARGLTRDKITWCQRASEACAVAGRRWEEGRFLGILSTGYADMGELRKAIDYGEQALELARELGDRMYEGSDLGNLGTAYADLGEVGKAIEYYEAALAIAQEIGDRGSEAAHLGNLGGAYYRLGELRQAIEQYEAALAIAREIGDRRDEATLLGNLGAVYDSLGELRKAIECHEPALAIAQEIGDRVSEQIQLSNLGNAYRGLGEVRKAIQYHEAALAIAQEIGDRRVEGHVLDALGVDHMCLGDLARARGLWSRSLAVFEAIEHPSAEQIRTKLTMPGCLLRIVGWLGRLGLMPRLLRSHEEFPG
jgi:tetratricopeptide (TPR) repeat protein